LKEQLKKFSKREVMNMSTPGEQVQILEERVKELKDRLGTCDDTLRVSLERELRISDEKKQDLAE
jgi:hypothetical protein